MLSLVSSNKFQFDCEAWVAALAVGCMKAGPHQRGGWPSRAAREAQPGHEYVHSGHVRRLAPRCGVLSCRIFNTETNFSARRFVSGLPPMPEPSFVSILW